MRRLTWWGYCSAHRRPFGGTLGPTCPGCDAGEEPWWLALPDPLEGLL